MVEALDIFDRPDKLLFWYFSSLINIFKPVGFQGCIAENIEPVLDYDHSLVTNLELSQVKRI